MGKGAGSGLPIHCRPMQRGEQGRALRWTLRALDGRLDPSPFAVATLPAITSTAFSSGLTGLLAWLDAAQGDTPEGWRDYLVEQRQQLAARHDRFVSVVPLVLDALHRAGVVVVPVKGLTMAAHWPDPRLRPMTDLDLVVDPAQMAMASDALAAAGFARTRVTAWETVHQAWPGVEPLRRDGESIDHPATIELHPGWVERAQNYLINGPDLLALAQPGELAGAPCHRLSPITEVVHALAHLSVAALRGEARPSGVVDLVLASAHLTPSQRDELWFWCSRLDPRLIAPGVWLVEQHRPGTLPPGLLDAATDRLGPRASRCLRTTGPDELWRQSGRPSSLRWRHSFASSVSEHAQVIRQALWPAAVDRSSRSFGAVLVQRVRGPR